MLSLAIKIVTENIYILFLLLLVPNIANAFEYEYARPAYDSGWRTISRNQSIILTHDLKGNADDYVVDMQIRQDLSSSLSLKKIHNRFYGGNIRSGSVEGVGWFNLNSSSITVYRGPSDDFCQEVRLRIWRLATSDYDSGWISLQKGGIRTITHNLSGSVDDYVVYMESKNIQPVNGVGYGIHQIYFGGAIDTSGPQPTFHGVQWSGLTSSSITAVRGRDDNYSDQIRIRIWRVKHPDFDSGWLSINTGQDLVLPHGINSPFNDYVIYLEFKDNDGLGINNIYLGGRESGSRWKGAYVKQVTGSEITLYRNVNDTIVDQIRVRIWKCSAPLYNSGWVSIPADGFVDLAHGLSGTVTDDYLVVMELQNPDGTVHNCFIGGTDVELGSGELISLGAYWLRLTDTTIRIQREKNDEIVSHDIGDKIRIRIWIPPMADIDSGWIDPRGQGNPVSFNLGGNPDDYFVYIEGKDTCWGGMGRNIYHLGGDTYLHDTTFRTSGFYWSGLTTTSVSINVGDFDLNEKIRIRIWKKGGITDRGSVNRPTTDTYYFFFPGASKSDCILDMQFDYLDPGATSNRDLGKIWAQLSHVVGAYWRRDDSQWVNLHVDENMFDKIRLYIWDAGWQPKQSLPKKFPWPMFLPAIISGHK